MRRFARESPLPIVGEPSGVADPQGWAPEPAHDAIRVAMVGAESDPHEVQFPRGNRAHAGTVLFVAPGRKHPGGGESQRHRAARRSLQRSSQEAAGGLEDQVRLHEQRQIRDAVAVLVGLADRLGLRRSDDAADEEPGDVQALPGARSSRTTTAALVEKSPTACFDSGSRHCEAQAGSPADLRKQGRYVMASKRR